MISSICSTFSCLLLQFPFGTMFDEVDGIYVFQTPADKVYACEQVQQFYECLPINSPMNQYMPYL